MPRRTAFQPLCPHEGAGALMSHRTGIAAHVAIYLAPGVDIWDVYDRIMQINAPPGGQNPTVPDLHVEKVHVALGEIDLLADVHAPWGGRNGNGVPNGYETSVIGDWINEVRQVRSGGVIAVARTSTAVCMGVDN